MAPARRCVLAALATAFTLGLAPAPPGSPGAGPAGATDEPSSATRSRAAAPHSRKRSLFVGEPAPAFLAPDKKMWVKGEPILTGLDRGAVYVIEFWATWCEPCRRNIPAMTRLQGDFAGDGVVVIGVNSELHFPSNTPDTREAHLRSFIERQGRDLDYRILRDPDRAIWSRWMDAAGQSRIPTAFVVGRDGTLEFIGPPTNLEAAVRRAVKKPFPGSTKTTAER